MTLGLPKKSLEPSPHPYGREGEPLGAPTQPPLGGHDLDTREDIVGVVQWLSHAHVDDVGETLALLDREDLVDDLTDREVGLEALLACHTEETVHLAPYLRGDAERSSVAFGNKYRLDEPSVAHSKEILTRPIDRQLRGYGLGATDLEVLGQEGSIGLGDITHLVDGGSPLVVEPLSYLLTRKSGHPEGDDLLSQLIQGEAQQWAFGCYNFVHVRMIYPASRA